MYNQAIILTDMALGVQFLYMYCLQSGIIDPKVIAWCLKVTLGHCHSWRAVMHLVINWVTGLLLRLFKKTVSNA